MGQRKRQLREQQEQERQAELSRRKFMGLFALTGIGAAIAGVGYGIVANRAANNSTGVMVATDTCTAAAHANGMYDAGVPAMSFPERTAAIDERACDLSTFTHPDVEEVKVYRNGRQPIIYIPWLHPQTTDAGNLHSKEAIECAGRVRRIAHALYDQYGLNALTPEGLSEEIGNKIMRERLEADATQKTDVFSREFATLLNERKWYLAGSRVEGIPNPLETMRKQAYHNLDNLIDEWQARGWTKNKETAEQHKQEVVDELGKRVFNPFCATLQAYLKQDPGAKDAWAQQQARDPAFVTAVEKALSNGANGSVLIVGRFHEHALLELLDRTQRPYALIRPLGVGVPETMDNDIARQEYCMEVLDFWSGKRINNAGVTIDVNTGMLPIYHQLGLLPPRLQRKLPAQEKTAAPGTGTTQ